MKRISYILLLIVTIGLSLLYKIKKKRVYLLLIFIILTIYSGFRLDVGVDYNSYTKAFESVKNGDLTYYLPPEIGFKRLLYFINSIGGEQQLVFLLFSIVTNYLIYKSILNNSSNYISSILIYVCVGPFYLASFNGIRQSAAIALFLYSIKYIEKRSVKKYFTLIILGGIFFHYTILLFLPFYFILNKKISNKKMSLILILELFCGKVLIKLIEISPYNFYINISYGEKKKIALYIFVLGAIIVLLFLKKFTYSTKDIIFNNMLFLSVCTVLFIFIGRGISYLLILRMNNYFLISIMFIIPKIIDSLFYTTKNKSLVVLLNYMLFSILVIYFFRNTIALGSMYMLSPYKVNFKLF